MQKISNIQIGKNGITENFFENLENRFKKQKNIKISVLKSARSGRESMKEFSSKLLERLGKNYSTRIIGFTIAIKRSGKKAR